MTSPGSRWQLLLMADDGRIIPFRRIKGFMIVFAVLFVFLGLTCVGLGWWLVSETILHEETKQRLSESETQVARCLADFQSTKNPQNEPEAEPKEKTVAANPSAESIPANPSRSAGRAPKETASSLAGVGDKIQTAEKKQAKEFVETVALPTGETVNLEKMASATGHEDFADPETKKNLPAEVPAIALGDTLAVFFNEDKKVLTARFRIRNTGPRSSPVQGRCVAVFQPADAGPDQWITLPPVTLADGEPTGTEGNRFRISRFMDMTAKRRQVQNPYRLSTATVYVYAHSGEKITQKVYPVDIQASE